MSVEHTPRKETRGILVPLAPTIILSTFLQLNKGPHGEENYVDVRSGRTAAWLTTPDDDYTDMVIGPDGEPSPIAVRWNDAGPRFGCMTEAGFEPFELEERHDVQIVNLPEGERGFIFSKHYPGMYEIYTVFQMGPGDSSDFTANTFAPYIGKRQLVSGYKNRGIHTAFSAIRITDKTDLPFGRELKPGKP